MTDYQLNVHVYSNLFNYDTQNQSENNYLDHLLVFRTVNAFMFLMFKYYVMLFYKSVLILVLSRVLSSKFGS